MTDPAASAVPQAPRPDRPPRATYRLQFGPDFGFDAATRIIPYLARLGVSHVYASPFLMARPGSTHGYDIIDHSRFNPEIGDEAAFARMSDALTRHGMGLILDFVPNHMGVGGADNRWWLDVLEWGERSLYADFFDINWRPATPHLKGKVLLPFLGDHYGAVLERGELELRLDERTGSFSVWYFEHRFPLAVRSYTPILRRAVARLGGDSHGGHALRAIADGFHRVGRGETATRKQVEVIRQSDELKGDLARLIQDDETVGPAIAAVAADINGHPDDPESFRDLHQVLEDQSYRIAYWRAAADEINYRRFFDINDLAALAMERPEVFDQTHTLVLRLIAERRLQGLRIDHIDGLYDPVEYCACLQEAVAYRTATWDPPSADDPSAALPALSHSLYLVVEKILARFEPMPADWAADGSSGYDFLNLALGLFVDGRAEAAIDRAHRAFTGRRPDFEGTVREAKHLILESSLASEFGVLAAELHGLAGQALTTRDFTLNTIRRVLRETIIAFPIYRTYATADGLPEEGRRFIDWAIAQARRQLRYVDSGLCDFVHKVLTLDLLTQDGVSRYRKRDVVRFAMRFQQLTGPVMAKALEDTTFYRAVRLAALNEVGGDPERFGVSPTAFHRVVEDRAKTYPRAMLTTATHDHKRGEDTRLRMAALSEQPAAWSERARRWLKLTRFRMKTVDDEPAPSRTSLYLFFQTLVGAWPIGLEPDDEAGLADLAERLTAYMIKAVREAKLRTSWTHQNQAYETAVEEFVRGVLNPRTGQTFLKDFVQFQRPVALAAACHGLAQTTLKLTVPGVPDLYQGTETWDLSLVDPDNRRPVDFPALTKALKAPQRADLGKLLATWGDGQVKQALIARLLDLRAQHPQLILSGTYEGLDVIGAEAERAVAFEREWDAKRLVVVVPRLVLPLLGEGGCLPLPPASVWGDTAVKLETSPVPFEDLLSRRRIMPKMGEGGAVLPLSSLFDRFPVAVLMSSAQEAQ